MQRPPVTQIDDPLITYDAHGTVTVGLKDLWRGKAAFLVCSGPSINEVAYQRLAERGIASLGINNIAGKIPVKAMTHSDPAEKFHWGIFSDPGIIKLIPKPKLTRGETRVKLTDGSFKYTGKHVRDYPNVWGYERRCWWTPETFLTDPAASWGNNNDGVKKTGRPKILCTMLLGLRLLHFLGVRRAYLLGVDFWMDPARGATGNYAFPQERDAGACDANNNIFRVAGDMLCELRPYLDAAGYQVFNCNKWSRLRAFDFCPFEEALEDCRGDVPAEPFSLENWYLKGER